MTDAEYAQTAAKRATAAALKLQSLGYPVEVKITQREDGRTHIGFRYIGVSQLLMLEMLADYAERKHPEGP